MSTVTTHLGAPPERAFETLSDARAIREFVVGARNVRRFDPRWPEAGTTLHHSIGFVPFVIRDQTVSMACESPDRLVLEAHAGPLGTFLITFELVAEAGSTRLRVEEHPLSGVFALPGIRRVTDVAIHLRNLEMCRRLRRLVAAHEQQWASEHRDG
jgi:hypothetical protein